MIEKWLDTVAFILGMEDKVLKQKPKASNALRACEHKHCKSCAYKNRYSRGCQYKNLVDPWDVACDKYMKRKK